MEKQVKTSPSSRRAWIEIISGRWKQAAPPVALLTEGVDRNVLTMPLPER